MADYTIIAPAGLRIRNEPNLHSSKIVKIMPRGSTVQVFRVSKGEDDDWAEVEHEGIYGWMMFRPEWVTEKKKETPFVWKSWPTEHKYYPDSKKIGINQDFGKNPENYKKFGLPGHEGIDFYAPTGDEIYAIADGVVSKTGDERMSKARGGHNYGVRVYIDHEHGYQSIYAHLDKRIVDVGDIVKAGQLIGYSDNTGNSSGSHLHLTLKKLGATAKGETNYPFDIIDPTPFLREYLQQ